ncbi:MAG: DUF4160 domain-containing protein [Thermomonas sp.]|uniref:DUF4160 domain-containing protein n=1 Tax=Thermomonas sp. TaxID=1971895 RepID=UPI0039E57A32
MKTQESWDFDNMATVLKFLGYRVVIYSNDHRPCHVHVMNVEHEAIFELHCPHGPPSLRENHGSRKARLNLIASRLQDNLNHLCRQWRNIHGNY